jgi:predicted acyltransferase
MCDCNGICNVYVALRFILLRTGFALETGFATGYGCDMVAAMEPLRDRDLALDALRGITLALMTIVNRSIGDVSYAQLDHAAWNGLTLTDLVFPGFLFVVGASVVHTLPRYQAAGQAALLSRVARRTAIIFLCGVLLYAFPFVAPDASGGLAFTPVTEWRIPGVLQRIALCYGISTLLLHFAGARGAALYALLVLPLYAWVLLSFGDLTLEHNAVRRLDLALLGEGHLYGGFGIAFDPEGILSTFPAVVNALAGWHAARIVKQRGAGPAALLRLLATGAIAISLGLAFTAWVPVNKALWTSSYTLVTAGLTTLAFAALVGLVDVLRVRSWTGFFLVLGRNTLFLYLFGELLDRTLGRLHVGGQTAGAWIYGNLFRAIDPGAMGALLYAIAFMLCVWLVGLALDRRGIHIRV